MKYYANKGWLMECSERLSGTRTLADLHAAVDHMEQVRPSWVTDASIVKLRRMYHFKRDMIERKLAN